MFSVGLDVVLFSSNYLPNFKLLFQTEVHNMQINIYKIPILYMWTCMWFN